MTTTDSTTAAQCLLLAHFDTIADAPSGVARLRRLILQLAVQGRLVEQDPSDEPASVLLERICRQSKANEPTSLDDVELKSDSDIPDNWVMARIGDITEIVRGITFPASAKFKHQVNGSVPCLRTSNVQEEIDWDDLIYVPREYVKRNDQWVKEGDIIISMANSKELVGKVALVKKDVENISFGGFLSAIRALELNPTYLCLTLRSPDILGKIRQTSSQTVNIANISLGGLRPILIPLPPLAEQRRIVERVDALMALCDALEERQARQGEERQRLLSALVDALLGARDAGEAAAAWARLSESFDLVLDAPEDVAPLRQTVLQLAVQGRLVEQDPADETASVLLERIKHKRTSLLESGWPNQEEAKTQLKKLTEQIVPEGLETLPRGWSWATLMQCSALVVDCRNKTAPYTSQGIRLIRTTNIRNGQLNSIDQKYVTQQTYEIWSARYKPEPGDILITREAPMGEVCLIPEGELICLGQRVMLARLFPDMTDLKFMVYSLRDPQLMERVQDKPIGMTVQHLRVGGVESLLVPLPPFAEQRRIVERVDALMALCDALEARLREGRAAAERLAEALCAAVAGASQGSGVRGQGSGHDAAELEARSAAEGGEVPAVIEAHKPRTPVSPLPRAGEGPGVRATTPAAPRNGHTNDSHSAAATLLAERGTLTNGELQAALGLDGAAARALLKGLVAAGFARQEGERRGTRYVWAGAAPHASDQLRLAFTDAEMSD